ncbi:TPA: type II toxin-antitoxin system RelB/DinJ family antitoxin [Yersinia enterocolitica]
MATITIRIDDELKKNFDDALNELGISQTEVMINTCKYIVQNKKLPFTTIQQFKTPDELKTELYDKFNQAFFMIKDLAHNLENNKPIYPNHRRVIISTIREFTHYFDWFIDSLKSLLPSNDFFYIHDARLNAGYLALIYTDTNSDADNNYFLEKMTPYINQTINSFEKVLNTEDH